MVQLGDKSRATLSLEEDVDFIKQLIDSLDESSEKLNKAIEEKDFQKFKEIKDHMKEIQEKIEEAIR